MSYDPTNSVHGRARVPGQAEAAGQAAGRASAGRASVPVPGSGAGAGADHAGYGADQGGYGAGHGGYGAGQGGYGAGQGGGAGHVVAPAGRASVGQAPAGRASVGRASVGRSAVAGSAAVGSASLARPGDDGMRGDVLDSGDNPGSPPRGPDDRARQRRKRRRRFNIIIAAIAVFLMLGGVGLVYATYYFDNVELPENLNASLAESTTIYFSDGTTPMARLGDQNRTIVKFEDIPRHVQQAVVAAEDKTFYTNDGIDFKGIARAAWNNATGGELQGASTIYQQYARQIAELTDMNYGRKVREAVLAVKIKREYGPDQVMTMYLNTINFGRNAFGIEAAAKAFFNKSAKDLTVAEGMALAEMIKQPNASNGNLIGPYDPADPANLEGAKSRFEYVKAQMIDLKYLTQADAANVQYPTTFVPYDPSNAVGAQWGVKAPSGLIVHHIMDELSHAKGPDGKPLFAKNPDEPDPKKLQEDIANQLRNGGYRIVSTVDAKMQPIAEKVADPNGTTFKNLKLSTPEKLQTALVAVEPGTGRVKAYYGGPDGSGIDYAGYYTDFVLGDGELSGVAYPPGSTMKVYTAMAGLIDGYSIDSTWDATKTEYPKSGRTKANPVTNVTKNPTCEKGATACQLWEAIKESTNTPFYALTEEITSTKVVEAARASGVRYMVPDNTTKPIDLMSKPDAKELTQYFSTEVGIGQYGITVAEHANGFATIAARGAAAPLHFVQQVIRERDDFKMHAERINPKQVAGFSQAMGDDLLWAMQKVTSYSKLDLGDGRQSASKSGTWELGADRNKNAHAWFAGCTAYDPAKKSSPSLAAAVWVGPRKEQVALQFAGRGKDAYGSGIAGPLWREFLNQAMKGQPKLQFKQKRSVGEKEVGNGRSVAPSTPPNQPGNNGNNGNPGNNNGGFPGRRPGDG